VCASTATWCLLTNMSVEMLNEPAELLEAGVAAAHPAQLQLQVQQFVVNNAVDVPQKRSGGLLPHLLLSLPRGASRVSPTTPETLACIKPLACMCSEMSCCFHCEKLQGFTLEVPK